MKICYLGNTNSLHLKVFIKYFVNEGHIVHTFGRNHLDYGPNHFHHDLNIFRKITRGKNPINTKRKKSKKFDCKKNLYLLKRIFSKINSHIDHARIKIIISKIKPDIVHGHEVSAFGELTINIGEYPKILTVWGSDVFRFPQKSYIIYKKVKKSLKNVDIIHVTNLNTKEYIREEFDIKNKYRIIPWGIELEIFNNNNRENSVKDRISNKLNIHADDIILL